MPSFIDVTPAFSFHEIAREIFRSPVYIHHGYSPELGSRSEHKADRRGTFVERAILYLLSSSSFSSALLLAILHVPDFLLILPFLYFSLLIYTFCNIKLTRKIAPRARDSLNSVLSLRIPLLALSSPSSLFLFLAFVYVAILVLSVLFFVSILRFALGSYSFLSFLRATFRLK